MPPIITRRRARAILCVLRRLPPDERARVLCRLPEPVIRALEEEWCMKRGHVLFREKVRVPGIRVPGNQEWVVAEEAKRPPSTHCGRCGAMLVGAIAAVDCWARPTAPQAGGRARRTLPRRTAIRRSSYCVSPAKPGDRYQNWGNGLRCSAPQWP